MRAAAFYEHGGPDVIRIVEWPRPIPARGQALVRIRACALNHLDIFVRRGMPGVRTEFPHVSGGDIAGVVEEMGSGNVLDMTGDRVLVDPIIELESGRRGAIGEDTNGGLCEYIAVDSSSLIKLPEQISFDDAAALPTSYGTAYRMLFSRGRVQAGETVVVIGASGGVGTACVQLASARGARVIAVTGSAQKSERLIDLGASDVIVAQGPDFGGHVWRLTEKQGADVIVDYTGQGTWQTSVRALRHGGRLLTCGATSGFEALLDLRYVWTREQNILGSNGWERDDLMQLIHMAESGVLRPVIHAIYPLDDVAVAEAMIEARGVLGKLIIHPFL